MWKNFLVLSFSAMCISMALMSPRTRHGPAVCVSELVIQNYQDFCIFQHLLQHFFSYFLNCFRSYFLFFSFFSLAFNFLEVKVLNFFALFVASLSLICRGTHFLNGCVFATIKWLILDMVCSHSNFFTADIMSFLLVRRGWVWGLFSFWFHFTMACSSHWAVGSTGWSVHCCLLCWLTTV